MVLLNIAMGIQSPDISDSLHEICMSDDPEPRGTAGHIAVHKVSIAIDSAVHGCSSASMGPKESW